MLTSCLETMSCYKKEVKTVCLLSTEDVKQEVRSSNHMQVSKNMRGVSGR